jgi:N-methylhydantoinase A
MGQVSIFKTPTTPDNYINGVMDVLTLVSENYKISLSKLLEECSSEKGGFFAHASTISTNAIVEGKTAKTGLICTKGFRDILTIREGGKDEAYNWNLDYPPPYVPRYLTFPVSERINSEGGVELSLKEDEVRHAIRQFKKWNVKAIAVSLLWSIANPAHELKIGQIIKEEWPGVSYTLSHQLNPVIREYRRTSSAVINASLGPLINIYISNLDGRLKEKGYLGQLSLITSTGGIMSVNEFTKKPIYSVDCGPAMAPVAGKSYAGRELGISNVITVDMGGTSFDVSCVTQGGISISREAKIGSHILGINKVDTRSIGAGGGSIGWVDSGGLLKVGPKSAGAIPGPACYAQGGEDATVTDANLLLGYLDPDYFLGGKIKLDWHLAEKMIQQKVGNPLNLEPTEAAFSIWNTVNINMVTAIKDITIWQGIDPREYLIIAGGGAAGLHILPIMRELEVKQALVPKIAGALSAVGGIFADISTEYSASYYTKSNRFDYENVNKTLANLEEQAEAFFQREEIAKENRTLEFYVEAHYPYQIWDLSVALRGRRLINETEVEQLVGDFHEVHERVYGIKESGQHIECVYWRVKATGLVPKPRIKEMSQISEDLSARLVRKRKAYFRDIGGMVETPVYRGGRLAPGNKITGPAIIEEPTTTIVVHPKSEVIVTKWGSYLIKLD